jgi:ABC-type transporter MlaC component
MTTAALMKHMTTAALMKHMTTAALMKHMTTAALMKHMTTAALMKHMTTAAQMKLMTTATLMKQMTTAALMKLMTTTALMKLMTSVVLGNRFRCCSGEHITAVLKVQGKPAVVVTITATLSLFHTPTKVGAKPTTAVLIKQRQLTNVVAEPTATDGHTKHLKTTLLMVHMPLLF